MDNMPNATIIFPPNAEGTNNRLCVSTNKIPDPLNTNGKAQIAAHLSLLSDLCIIVPLCLFGIIGNALSFMALRLHPSNASRALPTLVTKGGRPAWPLKIGGIPQKKWRDPYQIKNPFKLI